MGVTKGIPIFIHAEKVRQGVQRKDLDTVLQNRRILMTAQRVHSRLVMKSHRKPLNDFASRKELLLAFHDAVLTHRNLRQVAGILHQEISVNTTIINAEGEEGNRGLLIDLDNAVPIDSCLAMFYTARFNRYIWMIWSLSTTFSARLCVDIGNLARKRGNHCRIMSVIGIRKEVPSKLAICTPVLIETKSYVLSSEAWILSQSTIDVAPGGTSRKRFFIENDYAEFLPLINHAIHELEIEDSESTHTG
ncbi:hypothetical protein M422DRAFT_43279 [Sphaerobolus stellatus SS14]|nr:hypothetical protein M422DRAFT_43279 [Sphaerobolus stellatus SS14]